MRNVFLLYMPPGNSEAMVHYEDTIRQRVPLERIAPLVSRGLTDELKRVFGPNRIAVWGSVPGPRNQQTFDRMAAGDYVIIVEGDRVRLLGQIAAKTANAELSRELWRSLKGDGNTSWSLVYFIANARELDVPFAALCKLLGFRDSFRLRGLTGIAANRLEVFYARYDDLYSVLVKLESRQPILERQEQPAATAVAAPPPELQPDDVERALQADGISDHVRMQWKLARLGIKAGEKVWVPTGDQGKLKRSFEFDAFDKEFSSGIDLPHSYVENIDVVWKQEFRIAAAYEIENSTSIYSGLLRFSDLMILAPNTIYPLFVVAPSERKNRLREQLRRPTFKRMNLAEHVRFLSYEAVDEIDDFFQRHDTGLTVDILKGRSEAAG
jgi:hypothetical protein